MKRQKRMLVSKNEHIHVRISEHLKRSTELLAADMGITLADFVREAIREKMKKEK